MMRYGMNGRELFDNGRWCVQLMPCWRWPDSGLFVFMQGYDRWWRFGPFLVIRYRDL